MQAQGVRKKKEIFLCLVSASTSSYIHSCFYCACICVYACVCIASVKHVLTNWLCCGFPCWENKHNF